MAPYSFLFFENTDETEFTEMSEVKQRKAGRKRKDVRFSLRILRIIMMDWVIKFKIEFVSQQAQETGPAPPDEASKEEYSIARWMRNNVAVKKTKFLNHTVEYFIGECFSI